MKENELTRAFHDQIQQYADVLNRYAEGHLDAIYEHVPHVFANDQEADCRLCQETPTPPRYCESCGHELL